MDLAKELSGGFTYGDEAFAIAIFEQIGFLKIAALYRFTAGMAGDYEQVFVTIEVDVCEGSSPAHDGLAQGHQSCGAGSEGKVLFALIQVEFAVFILVVGYKDIGAMIAVEVPDGESHRAIDDRARSEACS